MRMFKQIAAQGEITIRRVEAVPAGVTPMTLEQGKFIVGHSETGHHHTIRADGVDVMVLDRPPAGMRILYAIIENPTSLEHARPHDKHESIALDPGIYELRIAREFDHYAELARQSAD